MKPEDFIVGEVIKLKRSNGKYLYVKLVKKNWNTIDAVGFISKRLNINKKNIGYAGLKDKNAITTQYISLLNINIEQIKKIKIRDIILEPLFYGNKAIHLGDLTGNKFKIKINFKTKKIDFCENYFGEQRFSENNFKIGKALLKEDFKTALELMEIEYEDKDYLKYLRRIDKRLLSLYINSVQSYFWNKVVSEYLKKNYKNYKEKDGLVFIDKIKKNFSIPLIGFDVEFRDKFVEEVYLKLLGEEGIKIEDYVMRKLHEIMPISVDRNLFVKVRNFKYNGGYVSFELPKGSYATIVLKKLERFKNE